MVTILIIDYLVKDKEKLMNKTILLLLAVFTFIFSGCKKNEDNVLKVGATPVPHAELLNLIKDDLLEEGIVLEVIEFTDYIIPNIALNDGQIDVNFFQHLPYLESFASERNLKLESFSGIHVEPLGLYSVKYTDFKSIPEGATIAIPNDAVNGGRALLLLQSNGLLSIDPEAGLEANERNITENPNNFEIVALEAAQLPRVLKDVDAAVINGNYALEAGFNPVKDSLLLEGADSPYVNILTIREGESADPRFIALDKALKSEKIRKYILENYNGGVVPVF